MIWAFLKRYRVQVAFAWLLSFLLGAISALVFSLLGPSLQILLTDQSNQLLSVEQLLGEQWAALIDNLFQVQAFEVSSVWTYLPLALLILAGLRALVLASNWYLWEWTSERVALSLRQKLMRSYLFWSPEKRRADPQSDEQMSASMTNDVRIMREYIVHFYGGFPRELCQFFFYLAVLLMLSPKLTGIFILMVLPIGVVLSKIGKKIKKRSKKMLSDYSDRTEWLQQRFRGIETIKHYRSEAVEQVQMEKMNESLNQRFKKIARVKARSSPSTEFLSILATSIILYWAINLVQQNEVSSSVLLSFFTTLGILSQTASKLARYYNSNREGSSAVDRYKQLLSQLENNQRNDLHEHFIFSAEDDHSFSLKLENISFSYQKAGPTIIDQFSYQFLPGKIYSLCGSSGAGKSTLLNLILGLEKPSQGRICLAAKHQGHEAIGFMPQELFLNSNQVAENVSYPNQSVSADKINAALEAVSFADIFSLSQLQEGNAEGSTLNLSGGQKQRLLLSRLFYHAYNLILIDEGTSALDPQSEETVYQSILKLARSGACVIVIAHRPSIVKISDQILFLENGKLRSDVERAKLDQDPELRSFLQSLQP